ncbi:hypothetical protein PENSPDRAFT_752720 [Peniophora sp. CONT]|nr:hypothetical protein PENSPDRAFT_752720 [Peniophora sp. CONT]
MNSNFISRLVDDIIRELYLLVALQEPPYAPASSDRTPPRRSSKRGPPLGWIRLTHVSRQWRAVGLNVATLWANIICVYESNDAANAALMRARNCPYTIELLEKKATKRRCDIAAQALTRVGSLSYIPEYRNTYEWPWVAHLSGKELPTLRSLRLYSSNKNLGAIRQPLVALNLQSCSLSVDFPFVAPDLRVLAYDGTTRITLSRLLTRIAGFPNLVELFLGTVPLPDITDHDTIPKGRIQLPALQYLHCCGDNFTCISNFIQHLDLPSNTAMFVTDGDDEDGETRGACRALVHSLAPQLVHSSRTTLRIAPNPVGQPMVQVHSPGNPVSIYGPREIDTHTVDGIVIDSGPTPLYCMLSPLCTIVGGHVTAIFFKALNIPWSKKMTATLSPLRAVVELHIWGRSRGILAALAPRGSASSPDISLPSLKTLVVNVGDDPEPCDGEVWDAERDEIVACRHNSDEFGAGWLAGLIPILQARARAGSPIKRLKITGPLDCRSVLNKTQKETCARVAITDIQALRGCVTELLDERA